MMKWVFLFVAGLLEVGWAVGLKYSDGFTKLVPSIYTILGMIASFHFFIVSIKKSSVRYGICNLDRNWYSRYCNFGSNIVQRTY